MGKALYDGSERARAVFERADRILDFPLSRLCFEGPEEELIKTENAQPAIVATSIAALEALREAHPDLGLPRYAAGHSLGEYSAWVAADALELEDALRVVRERGRAMQDAVPQGAGGMAAIMGATPEQIEELCRDAADDEVLSPANFNAPGQTVIAGAKAAVERAIALCKERSFKAISLKVSAPFHCSLMAPAAQKVEECLRGVRCSKPRFPVIVNVDATPNEDENRIADLLVRQVDSPVRWYESVRLMADAGVTRALELGPGKVLAGLAKRSEPRLRVFNVSDPESAKQARAFLQE